MRLVGAAEMRAIDRAAIAGLGIPGMTLMAAAGAAVAGQAQAMCRRGRLLVLCGAGNNGGDGYLAARLLHLAGREVRALALVPTEQLQGDARTAWQAAAAAGVALGPLDPVALQAGPGDLLVDALLGTGLARAPEERLAGIIARVEELRRAGAGVLAVDVPSGLPADGGDPPGACLRADRTVTFAFPKRGLVLPPGSGLAGDLVVADIGIPAEAAARVPVACELLVEEEARALVPPRDRRAHKGDAGRVLVVAGSPGKTGAAHLAVAGALRGGAGLVTLAARDEVLAMALAGRPEAMGAPLPGHGPLGRGDLAALLAAAGQVDALVVGPGIPRGPETAALLRSLLAEARLPAVIDADALNALALAGPPGAGLADLRAPVVATPHPGEMARLCGMEIAAVQADRVGLAGARARAWGCTVVLKGAGTVVGDPTGPPAVIAAGNPGMATGGTGDVLAGLVGALLAGGSTPRDAARAGAFVHARAGDLAAARLGQRGMLAGDLAEAIAAVWAAWGR